MSLLYHFKFAKVIPWVNYTNRGFKGRNALPKYDLATSKTQLKKKLITVIALLADMFAVQGTIAPMSDVSRQDERHAELGRRAASRTLALPVQELEQWL